MFYAYVLRSLKNDSYYFGSTQNIEDRLKVHNAGKSKYTKPFRPWVVISFEEYQKRKEAFNREMFFKCKEGREWLKSQNVIK